jgi:hypothetical protein
LGRPTCAVNPNSILWREIDLVEGSTNAAPSGHSKVKGVYADAGDDSDQAIVTHPNDDI